MKTFKIGVTTDPSLLKRNDRDRQVGTMGEEIMLGKELVIRADAIALIEAMTMLEQLGIDEHTRGELRDPSQPIQGSLGTVNLPIGGLVCRNSVTVEESLGE
jgi:hypothetical protein